VIAALHAPKTVSSVLIKKPVKNALEIKLFSEATAQIHVQINLLMLIKLVKVVLIVNA
jgi:hypothetical protein